jgi:hypothetical protein
VAVVGAAAAVAAGVVLGLGAWWRRGAAEGVVAELAGLAARRGPRPPGSWLAYGPGLALALLPSLVLAVDGHGLARPLLLSGGALAVLLAGARARLQAPLVLGAGTLVGLARRRATDRGGPAGMAASGHGEPASEENR